MRSNSKVAARARAGQRSGSEAGGKTRSGAGGKTRSGAKGNAGGEAGRPTGGRAGAKAGREPRASLYDEVTQRIVAELEAGRFPWVQPWSSAAAGGDGGRLFAPGLPGNALSRRPYSGINILILWGAAIEHGWLTFRQALEAGGNVRKGEHGTSVVYADRFVPETEKARVRENGGDARTVPFLKRFTVFNTSQCEGLRGDLLPEPVALGPREVVPVAEQLIAASGIDFRIGGDKAYYAPGADFVAVPPQQAFHDQINFYRTCLHELTHATGHASRLARNLANAFGSKDYAREELVAEMGSAFLCASLGIVPTVRHADYLGAWLEVLREDNRAIFRAASMASKASDWLLARHHAAHAAGDSGTGGKAGPNAEPGAETGAGPGPGLNTGLDAEPLGGPDAGPDASQGEARRAAA